MRRKMGTMPPSPMDESGDMGGEGAPGDASPENNDSKTTAFLPKELGGGKQWKPGDEIVLKIDAVDPETGEMQVSYAPETGDESEMDDSPGPMEAFDKSMPDNDES